MILSGRQRISLEEEALSSDEAQFEVIQRLMCLVNQQNDDLTSLLKIMAREVCDTIKGAQFCLILLKSSYSQYLEVAASAGIGIEELSAIQRVDTETSFLGQVLSKGIPQLFINQQKPPACNHLVPFGTELPATCCPASLYAVVIESVQTGRIGVLTVGHWHNLYAFSTTKPNFLHLVSGLVAIAINQVRTHQALKETKQRLVEQSCEIDQLRQQTQLQQLQLLEAKQLKSQLLAITSHELRTPLNVILGLSQVLLRQRTSTLSEQQVDMVQRILNNGNQLLTVIEDLLYVARVEAGCIPFQAEELDLTNLVSTTVAEHRLLAEGKRLRLVCQVSLKNSLIVNDSVRLKQVLVKLLLNAIKFTETGSIEVTVWDTPSDRVVIAIKDTGIGIADSDIRHIFDQFRQVDQTNSRKYGGTGLGLAITKSLIDIMQGHISVSSQLGHGSSFCIELPRKVRWKGSINGGGQHFYPSQRMIF